MDTPFCVPQNDSLFAVKQAPQKLSLSGRVVRGIERISKDTIASLSIYPTSIVSDATNRFGSMASEIAPLVRGRPFCGCAITVEESEAGNLMSHAALDLIEPGDVLVIDAKGVRSRSCWGGIQTAKAKAMGAVAVVLNGCVRDYDEIVSLGLPVYGLGVCPGGPLKGWGGNVNCPISCGNVPVLAGDLVMGDDDGVIVVPRELAAELVECCRNRIALEKTWYEKLSAGESTLDMLGLRKKLSELNVRFV